MLLGVTGDMVLPKDVYEKLKLLRYHKCAVQLQADILKEDQAAKYVYF